ncbi:MAG: response regulator transcription factor [Spirochaetia bacterium]
MARIIVTDDEPRMLTIITDYLKRQGHTVVEAENGIQAVHTVENDQEIDLLILDVMMPTLKSFAQSNDDGKSQADVAGTPIN